MDRGMVNTVPTTEPEDKIISYLLHCIKAEGVPSSALRSTSLCCSSSGRGIPNYRFIEYFVFNVTS